MAIPVHVCCHYYTRSGTVHGCEVPSRVASFVNPQREDSKLAQHYQFIKFVRNDLKAKGLEEQAATKDYFEKLRFSRFKGKKTRDLSRIWEMRKNVESKMNKIGAGKEGGVRTNGQHGRLIFKRLKRTSREGKPTKVSALKPVYDKVQLWFERLRSSGQYVDKNDLYLQYVYESEKMLAELVAGSASTQPMGVAKRTLMRAIKVRQLGHENTEKNCEYTKN